MRNGEQVFVQCSCMTTRKNLLRIEKSGLSDMLESHTFESFEAKSQWQKSLKDSAKKFSRECAGDWFFVGGQVGAGKTHLCTAIVGELLKSGKSARYMLWRDEVVRIKACVNDEEEYGKIMRPLKETDVLYIDDFLKTQRDKDGKIKPPTPGDINVAFELINYRYGNRRLVTIISCELFAADITDIDEAIGSRIAQRSKMYCNLIGRDRERNYRLNGG